MDLQRCSAGAARRPSPTAPCQPAPGLPPPRSARAAGRKVWHLRVDLHVLDHQGNLVGACGLAALAALMAFRRPDVTVGGGDDGQVRGQQ